MYINLLPIKTKHDKTKLCFHNVHSGCCVCSVRGERKEGGLLRVCLQYVSGGKGKWRYVYRGKDVDAGGNLQQCGRGRRERVIHLLCLYSTQEIHHTHTSWRKGGTGQGQLSSGQGGQCIQT